MECENLKLPEQVVVGSSSPPNLADPCNCFAFGSHIANWSSSSSSSTPIFSSCSVGNSNPNYDIGMVSNSSTSTSQKSSDIDQSNNITNLVPSDHHHSTHDHHQYHLNINNNNNNNMTSSNNILVNDLLGFPWNNSTNQSSYDMQLAKIKEEFSESLPRFTDLLNSPSSRSFDDYGHFRRGQFSQIYPSVHISNLNNYQFYKPALDHLAASARFMGTNTVTSDNYDHHQALNDNISLAVLRDSNVRTTSISNNLGLVQMQQPHDRLSCGRSNQVISSMNSEMMEIAKRSSTLTETKLMNTQLTAPNKKSRSESRTSIPPFKVRKEKLGDRIAALQQLVSPFGKTDTASVLMEAIGYIKFLQNQVETLSVPYMKSLRNKSNKTIQGGLKEEGIEEARRDLRSRGLCLVPLSCMSYVTGDHGGGSMWPPP